MKSLQAEVNYVRWWRWLLICFVVELAGGTVHLVCRNKGRAEAARDEIVEQSKNQVIILLYMLIINIIIINIFL